MLKIPNDKIKDFLDHYQTHRVNIAGANVYFHTAVMLNGMKINYIDRNMYQELFLNMLSDIEMVTPPTDAFVPCGEDGKMFVVNQLVPEYVEISKRIPFSLLEETFSPASALVILLKSDPTKLELVHDDIFIWYCLFKYIDMINMIRLNMFSNYTPIIEYVVDNISLDDWKHFLQSKNENEEKYGKYCEDLIFNPDMPTIESFYLNEENNERIPTMDVKNLLIRMVTNLCIKNEIILILGAFMTINFAMKDFNNDKVNIDESKCAKYVRDVLSKL